MTRYANQTTVSPERSRAEIERTITRYGAEGFGYGWQGDQAMVTFQFEGKTVRFMLTMPDRDDDAFCFTAARRKRRSPEQRVVEWEKGCRQVWRALALVVKAKLEAVEAGIMTFEEEFMPYLVLPNGQTVAQQALPAILQCYATGRMPVALLPGLPTEAEGDEG